MQVIASQVSFHDLFDKNEMELKSFLSSESVNATEQECYIICTAFQNLKAFCEFFFITIIILIFF
jgi:hypothetical protein